MLPFLNVLHDDEEHKERIDIHFHLKHFIVCSLQFCEYIFVIIKFNLLIVIVIHWYYINSYASDSVFEYSDEKKNDEKIVRKLGLINLSVSVYMCIYRMAEMAKT